jgi:hypothetical protein
LGLDILEYACADLDADEVEFSIVGSHGAAYQDGIVTYVARTVFRAKRAFAR